MLGHHRPASETPVASRWRADDGPLIVIFGSSLIINYKSKKKVELPLKKLSGSAHEVSALCPFPFDNHLTEVELAD